MSWLVQKETLLPVVVKHLPRSEESCSYADSRAECYSSDIAFADRDREHIFGVSADANEIEELRRHLFGASRALQKISSGTHSWLNHMIGDQCLTSALMGPNRGIC